MTPSAAQPILREGSTCWRIVTANRLAFLIDAAAYYEAFAAALERARRTVYAAAWDIDSRLNLRRRGPAAAGLSLADFLNQVTARTRRLHTYILAWDYYLIFAREREWLPIVNLGWRTHHRVYFHLDDHHPVGASHHQKFAVVDDRVGFCGSVDLTSNRWDTPEHRPHDPRRFNPNGRLYTPFHEVQAMVDGEAAQSLGSLFRERWQHATGHRLAPPESTAHDPWPDFVRPDARELQVGLVRTQPRFLAQPEVRETERLYLAAIAAAERTIYIENQYLTSMTIGAALAERLKGESGPEIVVVLPRRSSGWLEQSTMDALRCKVLDHLVASDHHARLKIYYPCVGDTPVYVHSKLMVVDERLCVVGSANLNSRAMGLDTECSLAVEATGKNDSARAIRDLRDRLVAEHLGRPVAEVAAALARGGLADAIERLGGPERRLAPLDYRAELTFGAAAVVEEFEILDPERPTEFDQVMDAFAEESDPAAGRRSALKLSLIVLVPLGLAAAWRWTPLGKWLTIEVLSSWAGLLQDQTALGLVAVAIFVLGGLVMVPVLLLVGASAVVFPPLESVAVSLSGCLCSAAMSYFIGSRLGRNTVRKVIGKRLHRLNRRLAERGILAIALIRNLPVAPFSIVNLLAGASHIRFRDYLLGTALGMLPGIVGMSIFADRLLSVLRSPNVVNVLVSATALGALVLGFWWLQRRLVGNRKPSAPEPALNQDGE
jgi:phosphatidylserine/phosphatidylglycerophosphate/cardiolipin synthase-like enzyme/uncharacterized membrane protein YdjX (TVP38/TMEM64 family)